MFDDNEDDERFRNFIIFKFWGTDEEMEEAAPAVFVGVLVVIAIIILVAIF